MAETIKIRVNPDINDINAHSKFTKQNLLDLNNPSKAYLSPLSTIAHIDVNAFFAQVEQLRTGLSVKDPVVCVQWSTLIAVSYAARDYGISRMDTLDTAKLKCPDLKPIHTATFKKGENFWRYRDEDDKFPHPSNHKVSLDPYRRESRKLMQIFKNNCDLVEKASVDESFIDLGRLLIVKLFEYIPDFKIDHLEKDDYLPNLPTDLELTTWGHLIKSDDEDKEVFMNDYDDLFTILGSIITHEIRKEIEDSLGYTTSSGIHQNKTVAKLASGFKKPNNQTIVLPSQTLKFLNNFELTDFWSMGGKTGEFLTLKLIPEDDENDNSIQYIRNHYTLSELKILLDDDQLATKLFEMVNARYKTPVVSKIQLKSMNSSKNMRGRSCEDVEDCKEWISIFAVDLYQRLMEIEDELSKKIRPKTISISIRPRKNFGAPHSKQIPVSNIYSNNDELEGIFFAHGSQLIQDLNKQYRNDIFPLSNLTMTISNFEMLDRNFENNNIMNFVKKGDVMDGFKDLEREKEREKMESIVDEAGRNKARLEESKKAKNLEVINNVFKDFKSNTETDIIPIVEQFQQETTSEPTVKDVRMKENIDRVFEEFKATSATAARSSIKKEPTRKTTNQYVKKGSVDAFKNFKKIENIEEVFKKFKSTDDTTVKTEKVVGIKIEPESVDVTMRVKLENQIKYEEEIGNTGLPRTSTTLDSIPLITKDLPLHSIHSNEEEHYEITESSEIICRSCRIVVEDIGEHDDYHYALNLSKSFSEDQEQEISSSRKASPSVLASPKQPRATVLYKSKNKKRTSVNSHKRIKLEKGQTKLPF